MTARMLRVIVDYKLEAFHRNAWRRYAATFFIFSLIMFCSPSFGADKTSAVDATSEFLKTVKKETQEKPPVVPAVIEVAKKPVVVAKISKEVAGLPAAKKMEKKVEKKKDEKDVEKNVGGVVTFIRKDKMAVQFSDEEEILLKVGKDVKLVHAKMLTDIAVGDKVTVTYVETSRDPKEIGGERFVLSMVVKEIALIGKAPKGLTS